MTDNTVSLASIALTMTSDALNLRHAGEASAKAQSAFARSTIAAVLTGVSTLAFAEAQLLGVFGSPRDAKGKAIKSASGLRDVEGGFAAYQAFRVIRLAVDNVDADIATNVTNPNTGDVTSVGDGSIRSTVTAFALGEGVKGLHGKTGLKGLIDAAMALHAGNVAKAMGVESEGEGEGGEGEGGEGKADSAPTLGDAVTALLLRLQTASDGDFIAAQTALNSLSSFIDVKWSAIADAENVAGEGNDELREVANG